MTPSLTQKLLPPVVNYLQVKCSFLEGDSVEKATNLKGRLQAQKYMGKSISGSFHNVISGFPFLLIDFKMESLKILTYRNHFLKVP